MLTRIQTRIGHCNFKAMKKHVNLILVLMSWCVAGIIGLQLFWNYQNYKTTVGAFQHDINESLNAAVDLEMDQRRQQLIHQFKGWLADTSFISITCDTQNLDSNTVFHINDRYPKYTTGTRGISFGLADFKQKLTRITPEAKTMLINHFGDKKLLSDLKQGTIYYYTQRLGDRLKVAYDKSHVRVSALDSIYKKRLLSKGIQTSFSLNPGDTSSSVYLTRPVNTTFGRPYKKELVRAGFESPDVYFLKTMKWVIITTLLLIIICLLCFGYTVKTLLSQHKLAELKDNFINNVTHELNTPLSSIKITAEALKAFDYSPERQKEYLDIISYQTEKLTDLTSQILNTNRLIITTQENWETIDLNTLIEKAIHDLRVRLDKQNAIIHYQPFSKTLQVYGEVASLLNVFTNIIDNALKYTLHRPTLAIRLFVRNGWVEIAFIDNGIGIPAEYQTNVFDPFFRVPQGKMHDVKGYGLGLSYVRQVLKQHRGSITVQANQPCGTQFSVNLPLV